MVRERVSSGRGLTGLRECLKPHLDEPYKKVAPVNPSFHLRRDSRWSIAYSEELISSTISVTLQSTDRHHGIVGQERCHNQRDS